MDETNTPRPLRAFRIARRGSVDHQRRPAMSPAVVLGLLALGGAAAPTIAPSTAAAATALRDDDPAYRAALLREGSRIDRAEARIGLDRAAGVWRAEIDGPEAGDPPHRLVLLPNALLAELERIADAVREDGAAGGDEPLVFRVSGLVTTFRRTNYLLMTHPPRLLGRADEAPTPPPATGTGDDGETIADDAGDVDRILADLDAAVGPISRRGGGAGEDERLPPGDLLREGTRLVDRRGRVIRTAGGGFRLVLDARLDDAPPLLILPCGLLEPLSSLAERTGTEAAVLVTGEVYAYGGRNYLMPTVYRRPVELTELAPLPGGN